MKKLCIVIPARNEQNRIGRTLQCYAEYFAQLSAQFATTLLVVNNASTDATVDVVNKMSTSVHPEPVEGYEHSAVPEKMSTTIQLLNLDKPGKGLAVVAGFKQALLQDYDYIGFVDADMATAPEYFYQLLEHMQGYDGVIASRYMPGAQVYPPRPWIKYWGRKLVYDNLVRIMFGLSHYDFQCGAKVFTRAALAAIVHECTVKQWAFDVELLYLLKRAGFVINEIPTVWHDQADSKLRIMRSGLRMLSSIIKLRMRHSPMRFMVSAQDT